MAKREFFAIFYFSSFVSHVAVVDVVAIVDVDVVAIVDVDVVASVFEVVDVDVVIVAIFS